jgi:hypothetical protein
MVRPYTPFRTFAFWFSCLFAFLVHCQLGLIEGIYPSDMRLHLGFILNPGQGEAAGYSLLHTLCGLLIAPWSLSGSNLDVVCSGGLMVILAGAQYHSMTLVHDYWVEKYPAVSAWRLTALVLSVFAISMIVLMPWLQSLYLGVFTGNPWHNPTFTFARAFAILTFVGFLRLTDPDQSGDRHTTGWLVGLAVAAAVSIWAKPSFMLTLGPAFGLILLLAWWRGGLAWRQVWRVTAALVPAVVTLLIIRERIYADPDVANSVVFRPGQVWGQYTPSYAMSLALAAAFPLYVAVVRVRQFSHIMLVATVNWIVALLVFYLLAEEGPRATHANFAWCYMGGLFFFFLAAIEEWFLRPARTNRWVWWIGTFLFAAHLFSGVRYLVRVLLGGSYM